MHQAAHQRHAGQRTVERILAAAEEVFIRFGYEGARMDQIAERANVRKANIYYYFESKEQLYRSLVERILTDVIAEVGGFLGQIEGAGERDWLVLDEFLDVLFNMVDRYRGLIGLAFGELIHPPRDDSASSPLAALMSQVEARGTAMIADGIARGVFRDEDPAQLLLSLEGALLYYFALPSQRLYAHIGTDKYSPEALARRKAHLRTVLRRILER